MYLTQAHIEHFRGIREFNLSFDEGVNIVFGPNEAGKSTFLTALNAALFLNADSMGKEVKSFRSWNSQADPSVRLNLKADGKEYLLEKVYLGEKKGRLFCAETGLDTTNKDRINEEIQRLLPLSVGDALRLPISEQSMRNTFWIGQRDLEATIQTLHSDANLRTILQNIAFNMDGDIAEIKRMVKKTIKEMGVGTHKQAAKNLGPVAQAEVRMHELRQEVEHTRMRLASIDTDMQRQQEVTKRLREIQQQIEADREILEAEKMYAEAKKRSTEANEKLDAIIEAIHEFEHHRQMMEAVRISGQKLREQLHHADEVIAVLERQERKNQLEENRKKIQTLLEAVRQKDGEIAEIIRRQVKTVQVARQDIAEATRLEHLIARKQDALSASQMTIHVHALSDITLQSDIDGKKTQEESIRSGDISALRANQQAQLSLPHLASITIASGVTDAANIQYEIEEAERALTHLFRKYNLQSVAELTAHYEEYQKLASERNDVENHKKGMLGGRSVEDAQTAIGKLTQEIDELAREMQELRLQPGENLSLWKERRTTLATEIGQAGAEWKQHEAAIQKFLKVQGSLEEAEARQKILARDQITMQVHLEGMIRMELPDDELYKRRRRFEVNEQEYTTLEREHFVLSGRLQSSDVSSDALHLKEAELEEAQEEYAAKLLEYEAYKLIDVTIEEAEREVAEHLTRPVEEIATKILPVLTDDRYSGITLDKDLRITGVQYQGTTVSAEELSMGAQGQLALAIRLSFMYYLSRERQTVVIDDALVHFDAPRLEEAKRLLTRFARTHQIIYMTCHRAVCEWKGAHLIEVG